MRRLLSLIAVLFLFAGLANGSVAHAAELAEHGAVVAAAPWQHFDGDADQVPADSDKNYPHHHSVCHGHELAAPLNACGGPLGLGREAAPTPAPGLLLVSGLPARTLRPPIA